MKGKYVKVFKDLKNKVGYEGDARIERVIKQLSYDTFLCDVSLDDCFFTYTLNTNDIIE